VVWEAITQPEKLAVWFTDIEMDFAPGGKIKIWFRDENKTASSGKILRIEPFRLFEYLREEELATWEVIPQGKTLCLLRLTYSKLPDNYAIRVATGWHLLIDQLEKALNGVADFPAFGGPETEIARSMKAIYSEHN
jgi:uncharacterized protein YndB with AHSA1/START domain